MKKALAFMLVLLLLSCGVHVFASQGAGVLISPGEHQWIEQGDKLKYTAQWWSTVGSEKIQWMMDGVIISEKPLNGETSGTTHLTLFASDYPVKTFPSGEISSYEFGCRLFSVPTAAAGIVPIAWDEAVVYICPPPDETAPESPLDVPPMITSLSWHKVADYNGDEFLGIELTWTPVEGAIGYEIFARTGATGTFAQKTECIENSVLAGFPLPTEETTYFFKVRAAKELYVAEADDYDYFTGPFSSVESITVPASNTSPGKTLKPIMTLQPDLPLPLVTLRPQLRTRVPSLPALTNRIPVITPTPTPRRILPIITIRIPVLPTPTPVPVRTLAPIRIIRP